MKMSKMKQAGLIILSAIMLFLFAGCSGGNLPQEDDHPFDFYIDLTTKDDVEGLSGEAFVESVFSFSMMTFQRPGYENPMDGQMALLVAPSFENLEVSPYADLVKQDPAIMQNPEKNPILISNDLANAGNLSVGDIFYQDTKASDEPLSFTVAGIFRQTPLFAQFEAVALLNDQISSIFSDKVDELGYTNAYVKASDFTALKSYFDEEFVPHLQLNGLSEGDISAIPEEDLRVHYEEYNAHMNRMN